MEEDELFDNISIEDLAEGESICDLREDIS